MIRLYNNGRLGAKRTRDMLGIKRITGAADLAAGGQPESWVMPAVKSSGGNSDWRSAT